jgi:hypothetical protein
MIQLLRRSASCSMLVAVALAAGCGSAGGKNEPLLPEETFTWIRQPVAFSPPPARWDRQGDNGGGMLGVRFILRGGGGQVMSVLAHHKLAERHRRDAIARLAARRDSLTRREFLDELSLVRPRTDEWVSDREAETVQAINKASNDYLAENTVFVGLDLDDALRAASRYEPTLAELLPHIRLQPERMQNPEWWRIGRERDTVIAGLPAFASDDTLVVPEQTLLYHEIFWVVNGCAFKAVFQGREENLATFHRVVESIRFPEPDVAINR